MMNDRSHAPSGEPAAKLQAEIDALRKEVETLRGAVERLRCRYTATCDQCGTEYDLLAHHYSVGLFDNVVYVKCPKCQKAVPVEGRHGGEFRLVKE